MTTKCYILKCKSPQVCATDINDTSNWLSGVLVHKLNQIQFSSGIQYKMEIEYHIYHI